MFLALVALLPAWFGGFPAGRLAGLALGHVGLALAGVVSAALVGLALGIAVTRPSLQALRPAADALAAGAQAVPPVVVVALAVPVATRRAVEGDGMRPEKRLFSYSVFYLFAIFTALVIDRMMLA